MISLDDNETPLEPISDAELAPSMETAPVLAEQIGAVAGAPRTYWQAQGLASRVLEEFAHAREAADLHAIRDSYYLLAEYYARTIAILRHALIHGEEPLVQAALRNLVILQGALHAMHLAEPDAVPEALTTSRDIRHRLFEDMIVDVLHAWPGPRDVPTITLRVNELDILADATEATIRFHLENLVASGHVRRLDDDRFTVTARVYHTVNLDQAGLHTLLDPTLRPLLERRGFDGVSDVLARKDEFRDLVLQELSCSDETATLFLTAAQTLMDSAVGPDVGHWRHNDLIGSPYPRPYQREAFAIFRGFGYQGQLIEAPTGSGKTLIGMMCIQDWLRGLAHGQTILVLVPTVNYQHQWVRELCHQRAGLKLPPHLIFSGTPATLAAGRRRVNFEPCVLVMTYAAFAQVGSGAGKGGFDVDSIETLLQENDVQYVILDEVHKVVEDLQSVSSDVTRSLTTWLRDGSLRGLIGFSGTAAAYRPRFAQLGLELVYVMPAGELIAYGFVAPFAELGVPFAYSEREQRFRDLVAEYYDVLHEYVDTIGGRVLRGWFSEIPSDEKLTLGRDLLHMYAGREDRDRALQARFAAWERGDRLSTTELPLVTMVQIARGWSDEAMAAQAGSAAQLAFAGLRQRLDACRAAMREHVYLSDTRAYLAREGYGTTIDADALRQLPTAPLTAAARLVQLRQALAATFVGLLSGLSESYRRSGEGRVAAIKTVLEAERAARHIPSVIVFDSGRRIVWEDEPAVPGYAGVAGLFAELLGDDRFTPIAVLSGEIYLPWAHGTPLSEVVADFVRQNIMLGELAAVLLDLATDDLTLPPHARAGMGQTLHGLLSELLATVPAGGARQRAFSRTVLTPLRRAIRHLDGGSERARQAARRLTLRQYYLRDWLRTFLEYEDIARRFERALTSSLERVGGARERFQVVRMPQGERKQLMYDLTARLTDAEGLPFDMVIVSTWARTGWNVITPNVLIDATATRDAVAWQQLRGRAMRAHRQWNTACFQLALVLLGSSTLGVEDLSALPPDVADALEELASSAVSDRTLSESDRAVLREAHRAAAGEADGRLSELIERGTLVEMSAADRLELATQLLLARNKVTHIYELVKAAGSSPQVRYNRPARRWERVELIAEKHDAEYAVSPLDGSYGPGATHAPLIYADDPRRDPPSALLRELGSVLNGADARIVRAWLDAIVHHPRDRSTV